LSGGTTRRSGGLPVAQRHGLGVVLILLMAACFAGLDTSVKYLGAFMPVLLLLWARYAVQAVVMAVWLACSRKLSFRAAHPRFQLMRGALLMSSSVISFIGLQYMPVAEFTAVGMLTPVVVTILAALFLNEAVSPLRWALVFAGFAGALIVIRPGSGVFGWVAALPLLMALCYGSFQALTAKLASLEHPLTTHFYTGLFGLALVTPVLLLSGIDVNSLLRSASAWHLGLLLAVGAFGTAGHLCLILALGLAPTATLMPFIYAQIAFAVASSAVVFQHVPDVWAWLGMAVISASGGATVWLNVKAATAQRRPASAVAVDTTAD
jgi:drug/metabolite transporter (DMT)-like permease